MAQKKRTRYTAKKLHRRNIRFWICYLVLLVLIVFAFREVYKYYDAALTEYEAASSDDVLERTASLFTERRFDELYDYEDKSIDYMETREDYVAYLNQLTANAEISYHETTSRDPEARTFTVTADGKSFATFSLRKTGEAAEFEIIPMLGYKLRTEKYAFDSISSSVLRPATYEVTVRDTDTVYVNGKALSENEVTKSGVTFFFDGHLPASMHTPTLTTYRFTCALGTPEIRFEDENGLGFVPASSDEYHYAYELTYCDDLMHKYDDLALTCTKNMARYTTKSISQSNVLKTMVKNSAAYNSIVNMDAMWLTQADKYAFANEKVENYVKFSDTVFCCEVSFDYNTRSKGKDNSYPVARRLYFVLTDGEWLIYDFENI